MGKRRKKKLHCVYKRFYNISGTLTGAGRGFMIRRMKNAERKNRTFGSERKYRCI